MSPLPGGPSPAPVRQGRGVKPGKKVVKGGRAKRLRKRSRALDQAVLTSDEKLAFIAAIIEENVGEPDCQSVGTSHASEQGDAACDETRQPNSSIRWCYVRHMLARLLALMLHPQVGKRFHLTLDNCAEAVSSLKAKLGEEMTCNAKCHPVPGSKNTILLAQLAGCSKLMRSGYRILKTFMAFRTFCNNKTWSPTIDSCGMKGDRAEADYRRVLQAMSEVQLGPILPFVVDIPATNIKVTKNKPQDDVYADVHLLLVTLASYKDHADIKTLMSLTVAQLWERENLTLLFRTVVNIRAQFSTNLTTTSTTASSGSTSRLMTASLSEQAARLQAFMDS